MNTTGTTSHTNTDARRRRLLIRVGAVLAGVVVLLLLLPTICSYVVVPGIIQSAVAGNVKGSVRVSGTSFSWFGSQQIRSIRIDSEDGATKLDASVTIGRSLLGLLFDRADLGKIDVTLEGSLGLLADGSTDLLPAGTSGGSGNGGARTARDEGDGLPAGLALDLTLAVPQLKVDVKGLQGELTVSKLEMTAGIAPDAPVKLAITGGLSANGRNGTIKGTLELDNGIARDGRL